jgi:hypothetical protein
MKGDIEFTVVQVSHGEEHDEAVLDMPDSVITLNLPSAGLCFEGTQYQLTQVVKRFADTGVHISVQVRDLFLDLESFNVSLRPR